MRNRAIRVAALAIAGGVLVGVAAAAPASRAQPAACLTVQAGNVVQPRMFTGNGSGSSQSAAMSNAQSNWSAIVSSFSTAGPAYAFWSKAAMKSSNCSSQRVGFGFKYTCTVRAQPCK